MSPDDSVSEMTTTRIESLPHIQTGAYDKSCGHHGELSIDATGAPRCQHEVESGVRSLLDRRSRSPRCSESDSAVRSLGSSKLFAISMPSQESLSVEKTALLIVVRGSQGLGASPASGGKCAILTFGIAQHLGSSAKPRFPTAFIRARKQRAILQVVDRPLVVCHGLQECREKRR